MDSQFGAEDLKILRVLTEEQKKHRSISAMNQFNVTMEAN